MDSEELTMIPVSEDLFGMLAAELALEEDRRPRHSLQVDGAYAPGLFAVAAVQNRHRDFGGRRFLAFFREVK
jgi:hypothetical protein